MIDAGCDRGEEVSVSPNPCNDIFFVNMGTNEENTIITVNDASGKMISKREAKNEMQGIPFDAKGWEAGVYFVTVQSCYSVAVMRLIVME